jgi:hypothetical protein
MRFALMVPFASPPSFVVFEVSPEEGAIEK